MKEFLEFENIPILCTGSVQGIDDTPDGADQKTVYQPNKQSDHDTYMKPRYHIEYQYNRILNL